MFSPLISCFRIRVTADISHWVVGCERLLVHHEDRELLARVLPHVSATRQKPQLLHNIS